MNSEEMIYTPPLFFSNGHIQTIFPTLVRRFDTSFYSRERINTPDEDFLDLDWSCQGNRNLAIISHGLEGSSYRGYAVGMVKALNKNGWDVLAWNYRSCSGETNRKLQSYHCGFIDDLEYVINYASDKNKYNRVDLIGFSMGGNITLLYLGKKRGDINKRIDRAVVFSVPCDLKGSSHELAKLKNKIYMKVFLNNFHQKIKEKMKLYPDKINDYGFNKLKNFIDYDSHYTVPINGFKNVEDYWDKSSSKQYIPHIKVPTLIVNAKNDPFLSDSCYPINEVKKNKVVILEMPESGGHVGFIEFNKEKIYWSEKRALQFLE